MDWGLIPVSDSLFMKTSHWHPQGNTSAFLLQFQKGCNMSPLLTEASTCWQTCYMDCGLSRMKHTYLSNLTYRKLSLDCPHQHHWTGVIILTNKLLQPIRVTQHLTTSHVWLHEVPQPVGNRLATRDREDSLFLRKVVYDFICHFKGLIGVWLEAPGFHLIHNTLDNVPVFQG